MLRSSRRRSKSSVHLTERWRNRRVSDRFSVRNTKAVRYCSGKRMQSIYPHLLSYSHSSVTPLGLSTYTSTYIFRVKAESCWVSAVAVLQGLHSAPEQFRTPWGDVPTFLRASACADRGWLVIAGSAAVVEGGCLLPCPETAYQPATGCSVSVCVPVWQNTLSVTYSTPFVWLFIINAKHVHFQIWLLLTCFFILSSPVFPLWLDSIEDIKNDFWNFPWSENVVYSCV